MRNWMIPILLALSWVAAYALGWSDRGLCEEEGRIMCRLHRIVDTLRRKQAPHA